MIPEGVIRIGDIVIAVDNSNSHNYPLNEPIKIESVEENGDFKGIILRTGNTGNYLRAKDLKMYEKKIVTTWNIVENIVSNQVITRILLMGIPGTGKTTFACKQGEKSGFYSVTLHEDSSIADLLGMWIPKGREFIYNDGYGLKAMKEGKVLVINEIDHSSPAVLTLCLQLLDDPQVARINSPGGEVVIPKPGYIVIATMNSKAEDLPLPLLDRFDVKIEINEPHPEAINSLPQDLREFVSNSYSLNPPNVTFREVVAYSKLRNVVTEDIALKVIFGNRGDDVKATLKIGPR